MRIEKRDRRIFLIITKILLISILFSCNADIDIKGEKLPPLKLETDLLSDRRTVINEFQLVQGETIDKCNVTIEFELCLQDLESTEIIRSNQKEIEDIIRNMVSDSTYEYLTSQEVLFKKDITDTIKEIYNIKYPVEIFIREMFISNF